eukprot:CAMPEP_0179145460 /NCGR_PEP_ID=MMETSP0796-20121207/70180_1 /TAXON_ID=73915 /ORGANISM="Pyrodinium bahamense, Strain pbaha01" /LENGTH=32 /DNA_ID= /DNA_START= /DNA_END= /DNA_ORIENTATION=
MSYKATSTPPRPPWKDDQDAWPSQKGNCKSRW